MWLVRPCVIPWECDWLNICTQPLHKEGKSQFLRFWSELRPFQTARYSLSIIYAMLPNSSCFIQEPLLFSPRFYFSSVLKQDGNTAGNDLFWKISHHVANRVHHCVTQLNNNCIVRHVYICVYSYIYSYRNITIQKLSFGSYKRNLQKWLSLGRRSG